MTTPIRTIIRRTGQAALTGLLTGVLVACASGEPSQSGAESNAQVLDNKGTGTGLESFEVRRQGRRFRVRVADGEAGARAIIVTARNYRGIDRADGRIAYDAAYEAGTKIDCGGGQPLNIFADSALFQEEGRRSAYTNGEAAWLFRGQCG